MIAAAAVCSVSTGVAGSAAAAGEARFAEAAWLGFGVAMRAAGVRSRAGSAWRASIALPETAAAQQTIAVILPTPSSGAAEQCAASAAGADGSAGGGAKPEQLRQAERRAGQRLRARGRWRLARLR